MHVVFPSAQMGSIHHLGRGRHSSNRASYPFKRMRIYVCSADQLHLFPLRKGYYPFSVVS